MLILSLVEELQIKNYNNDKYNNYYNNIEIIMTIIIINIIIMHKITRNG